MDPPELHVDRMDEGTPHGQNVPAYGVAASLVNLGNRRMPGSLEGNNTEVEDHREPIAVQVQGIAYMEASGEVGSYDGWNADQLALGKMDVSSSEIANLGGRVVGGLFDHLSCVQDLKRGV
jgi:hypothetical protein